MIMLRCSAKKNKFPFCGKNSSKKAENVLFAIYSRTHNHASISEWFPTRTLNFRCLNLNPQAAICNF